MQRGRELCHERRERAAIAGTQILVVEIDTVIAPPNREIDEAADIRRGQCRVGDDAADERAIPHAVKDVGHRRDDQDVVRPEERKDRLVLVRRSRSGGVRHDTAASIDAVPERADLGEDVGVRYDRVEAAVLIPEYEISADALGRRRAWP